MTGICKVSTFLRINLPAEGNKLFFVLVPVWVIHWYSKERHSGSGKDIGYSIETL
jgi:hypothetical protein